MEHAADAPAWAATLEASGLGLFMRQSLVAYPAANLTHLLGLVLLVGPISLFDLRVLGVGRRHISAAAASRLLTPFALVGLTLLVGSGVLMFSADARSLATSEVLIWKLSLAVAALANAVLFRRLWNRRLSGWDARPARLGQAQAALSIALWLAVATCGRMIAYL
jgi:hypothetical protein